MVLDIVQGVLGSLDVSHSPDCGATVSKFAYWNATAGRSRYRVRLSVIPRFDPASENFHRGGSAMHLDA